ncbi:hypothetical protein P9578_29355 [Brevibacillus choshinensis]|uniref:hypothetical protein n=1 Tax=Brevibacillus choshinensis TaxID=54911 RepID=UPI002E1A3694|nr:hypothetical protein [Brevibacillus choshinensis]
MQRQGSRDKMLWNPTARMLTNQQTHRRAVNSGGGFSLVTPSLPPAKKLPAAKPEAKQSG